MPESLDSEIFERLVADVRSAAGVTPGLAHNSSEMNGLFGLILETASQSGIQLAPSDLRLLLKEFNLLARLGDSGPLPPLVLQTLEAFLRNIDPDTVTSVLDLWTKPGSALHPVLQTLNPSNFLAASPFAKNLELAAKFLPPEEAGEYALYDKSSQIFSGDKKFDVITGFPPLGFKRGLIEINGVSFRAEEPVELLVRASMCLTENGYGFFILGQGLAEKWRFDAMVWQDALSQFDLHIGALIRLPERTFHPYTNIATYLAVIRKGSSDLQFWAEVSEENVEEVASNYFAGVSAEQSPDPDSGIWRPASELRSSGQIKTDHLIQWRQSQEHLPKYEETTLGELCSSVQRLKGSEPAPSKSKYRISPEILTELSNPEHRLYMRVQPFSTTLGSQPPYFTRDDDDVFVTDHPKRNHWYLLELNSGAAAAPFMESYLNSELGQLGAPDLYSVKQHLEFFAGWRVWVPPVSHQYEVSRLDSEIRTQVRSYSELRDELWKKIDPQSVQERMMPETDAVQSFKELSLANWSDDLPLPIATALWAYVVEEEGSVKESVQQLDWFFETLNAFMGILFLSVLKSDDALMSEHWPAIRAELKGEAPLEDPTQGTWLTIVEKLAKTVRSELDVPDKRENWLQAFACDNIDLLRVLTSKGLVSLLKRANEYRNRWRGHGAPPDQNEAQFRLTQYSDLLVRLREMIGDKWSDYPLVFAQSSLYEAGLHKNTADLAMGTRFRLKRVKMDTIQPLEHHTFNFIDPVNYHKLELVPFIQEGDPPGEQPAGVYFYNGMDRTSHACRFLSCSHPDVAPSGTNIDRPEVVELVNFLNEMPS